MTKARLPYFRLAAGALATLVLGCSGGESGGETEAMSDEAQAAADAMEAGAAATEAGSNPRFGVWQLESDAPPPASNVMTYEPYGDGGMKITVTSTKR